MGIEHVVAVLATVSVAVTTIVGAHGVGDTPPHVLTVDGQWHRVGAGWVNSDTGATYIGDVIQRFGVGDNIVAHGHGWYTSAIMTLTGQWQNGILHGEGEMISRDGSSSYRGRFKQGRLFGFGVANHADGCQYEGHFVDNVASGQGRWTDKEGQILEGQWRENLLDGRGRVTLADGRTFDGQFLKWRPRSRKGSFRGKEINPMGQVTCVINEWTSKRLLFDELVVCGRRSISMVAGNDGELDHASVRDHARNRTNV